MTLLCIGSPKSFIAFCSCELFSIVRWILLKKFSASMTQKKIGYLNSSKLSYGFCVCLIKYVAFLNGMLWFEGEYCIAKYCKLIEMNEKLNTIHLYKKERTSLWTVRTPPPCLQLLISKQFFLCLLKLFWYQH